MDPSLSLGSFAIIKLASKFSDGISKNKKKAMHHHQTLVGTWRW
jgi:hypothetical protein